jgi:hypothetical protein
MKNQQTNATIVFDWRILIRLITWYPEFPVEGERRMIKELPPWISRLLDVIQIGHSIIRGPFLALNCAPGDLKYQNESYEQVKAVTNYHGKWPGVQATNPDPVLGPLHLFPELKMIYKIERGNRELQVGLGLAGTSLWRLSDGSQWQPVITQGIVMSNCEDQSTIEGLSSVSHWSR